MSMPTPVRQPDGPLRHPMVAAVCLGAAMLLAACQRDRGNREGITATAESGRMERDRNLAGELAGARVDLARQALVRNDPGAALALLVAAVDADPSDWEALRLAATVLGGTRWFLPEVEIAHGPLAIRHLALGGTGELWASVSLQSKSAANQTAPHTVVRWDLHDLRLRAVMFPVPASETGFMVVSPGGRYLITRRDAGNARSALLCDAATLKPIRDLGI